MPSMTSSARAWSCRNAPPQPFAAASRRCAAARSRPGLTEALRDAIVAWLDAAAAAIEQWPLDPFDFSSIAGQLTHQLPQRAQAHSRQTGRWRAPRICTSCASASSTLRYQMELIEPLWPRFGRMWTEEAERLRDRLGRCQDLEVLKRLTGSAPAAGALALAPDACLHRTHDRARRNAPPASPCGCFRKSPRRSANGWKQLWEHAR